MSPPISTVNGSSLPARRAIEAMAKVWTCLALISFISALPAFTLAQTTNDAAAQTPTQLAPVLVIGRDTSLHAVQSESDLVGPAQQPEWTTRRVFAETDIYVIPPGEIEYNQFYISSHPRHDTPEHLFESEFEFGLPWRTQFDVELNYSVKKGQATYDSTLLELPHALANWGKIPLNPTIDGGWRFRSKEADGYFFRLLLAEQFGKRWHFGANFSFEQQVGGDRETDYEINAALSYAVIDKKLTVGAELLFEYEIENEINEQEAEIESTHSTTVMLGPTVLFRPTRNTHLGLMPLLGLTHDAPAVEAFFLFGIDLEPFLSRGGSELERNGEEFRPIRRHR
jgi:hypothetical protein